MDLPITPKPIRTEYPGLLTHWQEQMFQRLRRRGVAFPVRLQLPEQLVRYTGFLYVTMTKDGQLKFETEDEIIRL